MVLVCFLIEKLISGRLAILGDDDGDEEKNGEEHEENTIKHSRSHKELVIQEADEIIEGIYSRFQVWLVIK